MRRMQSDGHHYPDHAFPPQPQSDHQAWEGDVSAVDAQYGQPAAHVSNGDGISSDPHDFYRLPSTSYQPQRPDIVVQQNHNMTAAIPYRNPPAYTTDIATSPTHANPRPNWRSVSGPASSKASSLNSAKSTPTLSGRPQVRNLVNRFESNNESRSAAANGQPRAPRTLKKPSPTERLDPLKESEIGTSKFQDAKYRDRYSATNGSRTSPRKLSKEQSPNELKPPFEFSTKSTSDLQSLPGDPARRPLFGEVAPNIQGWEGPGYGITEPAQQRRGSEGNAYSPSTRYYHGRSQSTSEDAERDTLAGASDFSAFESSTPKAHRRTRSSVPVSPFSGGAAPDMNAVQYRSPSSRSSTNRRYQSPPSRIPVRTRRPSTTSESGSSHPSSRAGSSLEDRKYGGTSSPSRETRTATTIPEGRENAPPKRASTPPQTLSARRYGTSPTKTPTNNQTLRAHIKAPLPKTSPPLRSSRPRQPVSSATTSASRAKIADRFAAQAALAAAAKSGSRDRGVRPRKANELVALNLAERKANIEREIQRRVSQESHLGGSLGPDTHNEEHDIGLSAEQTPEESVSGSDVGLDRQHDVNQGHYEGAPSGSGLVLNTSDLPPSTAGESLTGTTEFEGDESPIVGTAPYQAATRAGSVRQRPQSGATTSDMPGAFPSYESPELPQQPPQQPATEDHPQDMLSHVMSLRQQRASAISAAGNHPSAPSEIGGRESVPIFLGATPQLGQEQNSWPEHDRILDDSNFLGSPWGPSTQEAMYIASSQVDDDGRDSPTDPFLGTSTARSSLRPEDSISIYNGTPAHAQHDIPPVPPTRAKLPADHRFTVTTEGYGEINRVLESYHNSSYITPQMAHGFQQRLEAVSPNLAQSGNWGSKQDSTLLLEDVLNHRLMLAPSMAPTANEEEMNAYEESTPALPNQMSTPEEEPSGYVTIFGKPEVYGRPQDHNEDEEAPTPPPKDWDDHAPSSGGLDVDTTPRLSSDTRPRLPEIEGTGEGLGLAIDVSSPFPDPASAPPLPAHSPPPPPTPALTDAASPPVSHVDPMRSPSILNRKPIPSMSPLVSPAKRTRTPVSVEAARSANSISDSSSHRDVSTPHEAGGDTPNEADSDNAKRLKKRKHIIKELVDTENSFGQDMKVVEDIYKGTSTSIDSIRDEDRKILFGNSQEMVDFSLTFLDALRHAAAPVYTLPKQNRWNNKIARSSISTTQSSTNEHSPVHTSEAQEDAADRKTHIGDAFSNHTAKMEKIYGDYLKNHDAANQRLQQLQDKPKVKIWLTECHTWASDITQAWDLDSLLVKPTQRILKYPLLLKELLAVTPHDHPDHQAIDAAYKELLEISRRINESKKRAEMMEQLKRKRKDSDSRVTSAVAKAFGRRTEKFRQQVGLSEHVEDSQYDAIAQKFGGHFFQLQIVMRDIEKYLDDIQGSMDQCNEFIVALEELIDVGQSNDPEIESKWRQFALTIREITTTALPDHKAKLRKTVIEPIMTLWRLHDGPQKLMQKRKKWQPEYARFKFMQERGEKIDKKTRESGHSFETLNDALKLELPRLYALTKKLVEACLKNFIEIQANWQLMFKRKVETVLEKILETTQLSQDLDGIVASFNSDFKEIDNVASNFSICNGSILATPLSPTTSFHADDFSLKRPSTFGSSKRTQSINSEHSVVSNAGDYNRYSGGYSTSQTTEHGYIVDSQSQPGSAGRLRASSAVSSRGPSTPRSLSANTPNMYFPPRPTTASARSTEPSPNIPRLSLDVAEHQDPGYLSPNQSGSTTLAASTRNSSSIFSSAMPMSESPVGLRPRSGLFLADESDPNEYYWEGRPLNVMFLAASLFEFNIAHDRKEAGIPYLTYVPGEVFDVIAQKGELWLARNQDDPSQNVGWIWEKHFARILPDEV